MAEIDAEKRQKVITQVKALWARADHPNTPKPEADSCREKAADLMARYEIEQFVLAEAEGKEAAIVLGLFRIDTYDDNGVSKMILSDERMMLAGAIARHFECKGIIKTNRFPTADPTTGKPMQPGMFYECIGFKHDFEMVRELYFSLVVDMLAGVFGEAQTNRNYQQEYARGYVDRIDDRLGEFYRRVREVTEYESDSVALAIRSRLQKVQDKFNEMYPPGSLGKAKVKSTKYDANAQKRGRDRANSADIGGLRVGSGNNASGQISASKKEIGRA